jgi:hypothetical protein
MLNTDGVWGALVVVSIRYASKNQNKANEEKK